jgi:hypothetical protein
MIHYRVSPLAQHTALKFQIHFAQRWRKVKERARKFYSAENLIALRGAPNRQLAVRQHVSAGGKDKTAGGAVGDVERRCYRGVTHLEHVTAYFLQYTRWSSFIHTRKKNTPSPASMLYVRTVAKQRYVWRADRGVTVRELVLAKHRPGRWVIIKRTPCTEFYEKPKNGSGLIIDERWAARRAVDVKKIRQKEKNHNHVEQRHWRCMITPLTIVMKPLMICDNVTDMR